MFGRKKDDAAKAKYLNEAAEADRQAAEHRAEIKKWRKVTDDPAAARYMINEHEVDLETCKLNGRFWRNLAK